MEQEPFIPQTPLPAPQIPEIPVIQPIPPLTPQRPETELLQQRMADFAPDTIRMLSLPPISAPEAERCKHRLENRWYRRLVVLNVLLVIITLLLVIGSYDEYQKQVAEFQADVVADFFSSSPDGKDDDENAETDEDADEKESVDYEEFAENIPLGFKMLSYGILLLTVGYAALYYFNAEVRSRSIKVTERNFPEVNALIHSFSDRLGIKAPDAYIVTESGVLNALSSFLFRRQFIQINSEIFEVAYREHKDMNALAFVIAHEISHIYYGHATLHYNFWIWFSERLPLVGQIASRTREYSCDRLAQRLTNYDGLGAMFMMIMDRHLYKMVDVQDYLNQAAKERGFFLWLVNLMSSHPVMTKRIRALAMWSGSGELY